jgi:fructose-1,6-bisphosphatase
LESGGEKARTHKKETRQRKKKTLMQTFRMILDELINEQRVSMAEKKQGQNSNRKISGG